jgi:hypothetical protein
MVGAIFGVVLNLGFTHPSYDYFWVAVARSSFTFGALLWRVLPERFTRRYVLWGVVAGILGSLLAHFTTWLLALLAIFPCNWMDCGSTIGKPPANIWELITGALLMGSISILVLGWLTSPAGAILGGLYAFILKKRGVLGL